MLDLSEESVKVSDKEAFYAGMLACLIGLYFLYSLDVAIIIVPPSPWRYFLVFLVVRFPLIFIPILCSGFIFPRFRLLTYYNITFFIMDLYVFFLLSLFV